MNDYLTWRFMRYQLAGPTQSVQESIHDSCVHFEASGILVQGLKAAGTLAVL